jgi:LAO/AO transport system kinase
VADRSAGLVRGVLEGDVRGAARLMRDIDDRAPGASQALKQLYPHTGRAHVIGITGSPGVGKSTLTDRLIEHCRGRKKTVGVVAVDPTSPFTGGAILGDRIRMQRHATDPGVFIRSLATRGSFGGLTASTRAVVDVLDAMGKDVILIETVGVGQDEVDVAATAQTTLIVTVPGLGDDVQAIKAGLFETGDLFVVNKCLREGAAKTVGELKALIELDRRPGEGEDVWVPEVFGTDALTGEGLAELTAGIEAHRTWLLAEGGRRLAAWRRRQLEKALLDRLREEWGLLVARRLDRGALADLVEDIAAGRNDPYSAAEGLLRAILNKGDD